MLLLTQSICGYTGVKGACTPILKRPNAQSCQTQLGFSPLAQAAHLCLEISVKYYPATKPCHENCIPVHYCAQCIFSSICTTLVNDKHTSDIDITVKYRKLYQ